MSQLFQSVSSFFSGGDQLPWCSRDVVAEPRKIYLVLEYYKGGDLSMFIQRRQGGFPKSTAVHFMQQLAAGLKVLRENQIIHKRSKATGLVVVVVVLALQIVALEALQIVVVPDVVVQL
ncbi:hypothetical protein L6452_27888 [Arctium lappa]|uniref:Uncharacterized protein n=1 Tax=Arctium lappa TaxID=4217 RepID=A0ACB8ZX75_ARCLA|nr:hypothetical protein L6452_27888 [Arctium lappa]